MTTADEVVSTARNWIGVKFRHQGRDRTGVDCAGLVICVAKELGLTDFDTTGYARRITDGIYIRRLCEQEMDMTETTEPGDVLLMRFCTYPSHLAIVATYPSGGLSIIHAYAQARRVVEHRLDETWERRIVQSYRLKGID